MSPAETVTSVAETSVGVGGADCTVTTIEGDLQVDFEVAGSLERDGARGPEREFTIGTGGAQVKIQTFDGPVTIRRR